MTEPIIPSEVAHTIRSATYVLEILTRAYVPKGTPDYKELVAALDDLRGLTGPVLASPQAKGDRDPAYMEGPIKTDALHAVIAERRRQIMSEGWTPEHDDQHYDGSLAQAAACYASNAATWAEYGHKGLKGKYAELSAGFRWPWAREWWKPKGQRRDLVRAGALILAEIERLDRKNGHPIEGEEP